MDFALKVILSFLVGGAYVSFIVWYAEKLGSKIGGTIAGIPTTLLVSLAFIYIAEGAHATKIASSIVPLLITAALFYSYIFAKTLKLTQNSYKNIVATLAATVLWLGFSLAVHNLFQSSSFLIVTVTAIAGGVIFHYIFRHFPDKKPKKLKLSKNVYLVRFVLAGTVVSLAVLSSHYIGATWGGVVASFPATIASSLYFLSKSQGDSFIEGFIKRLPKSFVSTLIFVVILHLLLTNLPTLTSFFIAIIAALFYTYILIRLKK